MCSTFRFWQTGSSTLYAGWRGNHWSQIFRLGCSVPAPERRPLSWRRQSFLIAWAPSSRAAVVPISPATHSSMVRAPTLLIVGGVDFGVIELNEAGIRAAARAEGTGDRSGREPSLPRAWSAGSGHRPCRAIGSSATSAAICPSGRDPRARRTRRDGSMPFKNRSEAGKKLAAALAKL